jgi:hypothetical protein
MAIPDGLPTVTVTTGEPLMLPDGTPMEGHLTFTAPALVTIPSLDLALGGSARADLTGGTFTIELVPTDVDGMSPTGWPYQVDALLSNAPGWTRWIAVPSGSTSPLKLADLLVPQPGHLRYLPVEGPVGPQGEPGPPGEPAAGALLAVNNLADLDDPAAARTHLGLGTAATAAATDFDPAGAAAAAADTAASYTDTAVATETARADNAYAAADDPRLGNARAPVGPAGGDLSGSFPNPTVSRLGGVAITGTPTAGQVPTASSGTAAAWQTPAPPPAAATTVTGATTYGQAPAVGNATAYARDDHTHGTPAAATKESIGLGAVDNTSDASKPLSTAATAALAAKADLVGGFVPTSQLPAIAITDVYTVASQTEMLALTAQRGDVAVRSDFTPARVYILGADDPTVLGSWTQISFGAIQTVNGQTGIVHLVASDVGALATAANLTDLPDAAAARGHLGLGTAATAAATDFDVAGAAASAQAAATSAAAADAAGKVSAHSSATTGIHGITDTAALVLTSDPRLTNARTPTTHASTHAAGGTDPLAPAAIGAPLLDATGLVTMAQAPGAMPPTRRMPAYVQASLIVTQMQPGHGFTQSGAGTFTANDTTDFVIPSQSCKIVTDGLSSACKIRKAAAMTATDFTGKTLRLRLKIDDITHLKNLNLFLGSGNFASYYNWNIQGTTGGSNFIPSGGTTPGQGWYTVTLSWADAVVSGSPARTSLTDLQLQVQDDGAGTVTLRVQDIEAIPDGSAIFPTGVISIGFDDVYGSAYTYGLPKLQQCGYRGSVYTIQSMVGTTGRMTLTQLYALQDYGWEMGSHAYLDADHALTYTGMTAAQLDADLRRLKAWEITSGLRGMDGTAYPLGQYGVTVDGVPTTQIVRQYNGYARTTSRKTYETFPPADPYRLRAQSAITTFAGGYAPSAVTGTDLAKIKASAAWGIYVFHDIVTGAPTSSTQIAQADFNAIVDAISAAGIPVLPAGDVLRYYG